MSAIFRPRLILKAALLRFHVLELSGLQNYPQPHPEKSSTTIEASAAVPTNMFILACGEDEGLAPGERLEVYGSRVRLVRGLAYGCSGGTPAGADEATAISAADLQAIAGRLREIHGGIAKVAVKGGGTDLHGTPEESKDGEAPGEWAWELLSASREDGASDRKPAQAASTTLSASESDNRTKKWQPHAGEVAVVEWRRRASPAEPAPDDALFENGVYFASAGESGLRVLRSARAAFISNIEHIANVLSGETRAMEVLDVSAIDFSFSVAAVQCGMGRGGAGCAITFVPLNDGAAGRAVGEASALVRQVVGDAGRALEDPFFALPARVFDVAVFTAHLDVPPSASMKTAFSGAPSKRGDRNRDFASTRGGEGGQTSPPHRTNRREVARVVAKVMAAVRDGAPLLVTFVPTPSSLAEMHKRTTHRERAGLVAERCVELEAKDCIAEAIALTGRWGKIVDEILPTADCPQGSAISFIVSLGL